MSVQYLKNCQSILLDKFVSLDTQTERQTAMAIPLYPPPPQAISPFTAEYCRLRHLKNMGLCGKGLRYNQLPHDLKGLLQALHHYFKHVTATVYSSMFWILVTPS